MSKLIRLDQNAGQPICESCLNEWLKYININNLQGFSQEKRRIQAEVKQRYKELQAALGFDVVLFNSGASNSIELIFKKIPTIKFVGEHHPLVARCIEEQKQRYGDAKLLSTVQMVNLVVSHSGQIQSELIDSKSDTVLDVSQAIGVIDLSGLKQHGVQCMFFSCHKIGGPFGTGFMACTSSFYKHYLCCFDHEGGTTYIPSYLSNGFQGTFNLCGFMAASQAVLQAVRSIPNKEQMYSTYKYVVNTLKSFKQINQVTPIIKLDQSLNSIQNTFGAVTFKLNSKYCSMAFQSFMEDEGVQIGFKPACYSGKDGVLRMSWKQPISKTTIQFVQNAIRSTFKKMDEALAKLDPNDDDKKDEPSKPDESSSDSTHNTRLVGGQTKRSKTYLELGDTFLKFVNANKAWIQGHFVPSHDEPPQIDDKYEPMFQKQLLNTSKLVSLVIPPHTKDQIAEAQQLNDKATENDELNVVIPIGLLIQNRRLAKFLWINWRPTRNSTAEPYVLQLEDFNKYEIGDFEVFRWPITLQQEVSGIDDFVTPFNLFVLSSLSKETRKRLIDENMKRHQLYVPSDKLEGRFILYPTDELNVFMRYDDLQLIESTYPFIDRSLKELPQTTSKKLSDKQAKSDKFVIHMLDSIDLDKIMPLVKEHLEDDLLIYVPFTTQDDIVETYKPLIQLNFDYEIVASQGDSDSVYDVWTQEFLNNYVVLEFKSTRESLTKSCEQRESLTKSCERSESRKSDDDEDKQSEVHEPKKEDSK